MPQKLKSRAGCITCKVRRVKCDETKPVCRRCSTNGRKCDGYMPVPKDRRCKVRMNYGSANQAMWLARSISLGVGGVEEQRAFTFFREHTAPMLGKFTAFTDHFWRHTIPQLCHCEDVIWHMVVAIGSRQETASKIAHPTRDLPYLSLKHFAQALQILTRLRGKENMEMTLIACMLFMVSENIHDPGTPTTGALSHFISGLKILGEWKRDNTTGTCFKSQIITTIIEPMFAQLRVVLSVFSTPPTNELGIIRDRKERRPRLPKHFSDLFVAQDEFAKIWRWRFHLTGPQYGSWTRSSPAFQDIKDMLCTWHRLLVSYLQSVPVEDVAERERTSTMMAEYTLLYLAFEYSSRTDIPENIRFRPSLVDLSQTAKVVMVYILSPSSSTENFDFDWRLSTMLESSFTSTRLWPIIETSQSAEHRGVIRLSSCSYSDSM